MIYLYTTIYVFRVVHPLARYASARTHAARPRIPELYTARPHKHTHKHKHYTSTNTHISCAAYPNPYKFSSSRAHYRRSLLDTRLLTQTTITFSHRSVFYYNTTAAVLSCLQHAQHIFILNLSLNIQHISLSLSLNNFVTAPTHIVISNIEVRSK